MDHSWVLALATTLPVQWGRLKRNCLMDHSWVLALATTLPVQWVTTAVVCALLISNSNLFQNCLGLFSRLHPSGLAPISIFSKFMGFLFFILGATISFKL